MMTQETPQIISDKARPWDAFCAMADLARMEALRPAVIDEVNGIGRFYFEEGASWRREVFRNETDESGPSLATVKRIWRKQGLPWSVPSNGTSSDVLRMLCKMNAHSWVKGSESPLGSMSVKH